jgi:hypothetical protein
MSTGWPQAAQKRAPAGSSAPQLEQCGARPASGEPQFMQNLAASGLVVRQLGHSMRNPSGPSASTGFFEPRLGPW